MARKVTANNPPQRRSGVNRAQLKALAARQAMTNIPTRSTERQAVEAEVAPTLDLRGVAVNRRRAVLTREEEFAYIRADLIRMAIVSIFLFAAIFAAMFVLR